MGRKKDVIIDASGKNVYPDELEELYAVVKDDALLIKELCIVGVPDGKSGEVVKIFVVRKDASLTSPQVMAHCRENLTGYKLPKYIEFRNELPKTNVGKILRRELRDEELRRKEAA